jgi:hypothetical protein
MTIPYVPTCTCLNCGYELDAAFDTAMEEAPPTPGDATICILCGHLMVFDDDLRLRQLNDEEIIQFAGDQRIVRAQRARLQALNDFATEATNNDHSGQTKE